MAAASVCSWQCGEAQRGVPQRIAATRLDEVVADGNTCPRGAMLVNVERGGVIRWDPCTGTTLTPHRSRLIALPGSALRYTKEFCVEKVQKEN